MFLKIKDGGGGIMKKVIQKVSVCFAAVVAFFVASVHYAKAEGASVKDALGKAGITGTGNMDGIYQDLNGVVFFVMALGGFWIVGMLVWGGMTLAGSGGNPQKRTEGFIKLSLVLVGAYIIFKAYDIAAWATALGVGK